MKPTAPPAPLRSLRTDVVGRLVAMALIALAAALGGTALIFWQTSQAAREQQLSDAEGHLQARIRDIEQGWLVSADIFRGQLEFNGLLESPHDLQPRLTAFMQSFGGQQIFSHVTLLDPANRIVYQYRAGAREQFAAPPAGAGAASWVFSAADRALYRAVQQPVWMGAAGKGRLVVHFPLDNALLAANAYPRTEVRLRWQGAVVASSEAAAVSRPDGRTATADGEAIRVLPWGDAGVGPELVIIRELQMPVTFGQVALILALAGVLVVGLGWPVLGRWATALITRLSLLKTLTEEFGSSRVIDGQALRRLDGMAPRALDEVGALTGGLRDMMADIVRGDEAQRRAAEELREALTLQHAILDSAGHAIISTTPAGVITTFNHAAERALGYAAEEVVGRATPVLLHVPEELAARAAELSAELGTPIEPSFEVFVAEARRGLPSEHEWTHVRKDGSRFPVLLTVTALRDGQGGITGFLGLAIDITERKQALQALQRSEQELKAINESLEARVLERTAELRKAIVEAERANLAKSEFLSRMSHELRTPLNAILGFAQLLALPGKTALDARQADDVQEILKAGQHLLAQVNEVLDLARIDSGRIELSLEPVGVAAAVADCLAQVKPLAEPRGLAMTAAIDGALAVQADRTRLKQVLLNLLSNAIKYNRDGGTIDVTAATAGERLRIAVRDSGRGIAPEKLERLFKPFERLESSYDGIEGTGIGLALVKRLVEAMGGEIGVDSTVGAGSTFWFALPAACLPDLPAPKVGAGGTAPDRPPPGPAGQPRRRVLYIEDNPANLKLVRKMLATRPDLAMSEAPDAERGLELAGREPPDLILLDINLPGMDGFAALRQLRATPATAAIPVVAITANAMTRDIERGTSAGFADYLTKPLDIAQLIASIDRQLLIAGSRGK